MVKALHGRQWRYYHQAKVAGAVFESENRGTRTGILQTCLQQQIKFLLMAINGVH